LIYLTIWNSDVASTIQNSLSRGITLDTTCSIVNKCIVGITKGTNRCGGVCGTHLIYLTVWSSAVASTIQNSLVRAITYDTVRGIISKCIVGNTKGTNQCAGIGGTYLIVLTICRCRIANIILNDLIRTITYDTVRGIVSEGIAHITLNTDQCGGVCGIHLIYLTIWNSDVASTIYKNLVRGTT
jgi:hypothetical protein